MTVTLRPITVKNWSECVELAPTEEQVQAGFVTSNAFSLAQASFESWWQPTGIYTDEMMVGFVMVGTWPTTGLPSYIPEDEVPVGEDHILRFMIDGRYQHKGYGVRRWHCSLNASANVQANTKFHLVMCHPTRRQPRSMPAWAFNSQANCTGQMGKR